MGKTKVSIIIEGNEKDVEELLDTITVVKLGHEAYGHEFKYSLLREEQ